MVKDDRLNNIKHKKKHNFRDDIEESKRVGGFEMIFPNNNYGYYKTFFEEERPLNVILNKMI